MEYTVSNYKNYKKLSNLHIKINSKLISRIDKNKLLLDAEFAHNLTIDTQRYNRGAKTAIVVKSPKNTGIKTSIVPLIVEV